MLGHRLAVSAVMAGPFAYRATQRLDTPSASARDSTFLRFAPNPF